MKRLALLIGILSLSSVTMGGDGTLPFGMKGRAAGKQLSYTIIADHESTDTHSSRAIDCTEGYGTKTKAKGVVQFGSATYHILAICSRGDSHNEREIISVNGLEVLKLGRGQLQWDSTPKTLEGTLLIGQSGSGAVNPVGRFNLEEE